MKLLWLPETHWERPWCLERLRGKGKGGSRGWDGYIASQEVRWGGTSRLAGKPLPLPPSRIRATRRLPRNCWVQRYSDTGMVQGQGHHHCHSTPRKTVNSTRIWLQTNPTSSGLCLPAATGVTGKAFTSIFQTPSSCTCRGLFSFRTLAARESESCGF